MQKHNSLLPKKNLERTNVFMLSQISFLEG